MTKALPKAYFPGSVAKISYRKVDKWAVAWKAHWPYFDTWEEAHAYMLDKATKHANRAKKEAAAAERHLKRVMEMEKPSA